MRFPMAALFLILFIGPSVLADEVKRGETDGCASFRTAILMIDTGRHALSAYQVEVRYDRRRVRIVGLEGAGKRAFKEPPFYDPKGMSGGRLVIGAFTTDDASAPKGRTAVARLHLHIKGKPPKTLTVRLMTAARPGGARIQARAQLQLMDNSKREMQNE